MTLSRLQPRRLALSAVLLACLLACLLATTARADVRWPFPGRAGLAAVTISDCPSSGTQVPQDYLGLSVEWSMVQHWFGTSRAGVVQPTIALLKSLEATPEDGGVLRIGGNSQDGYVWAPKADVRANTLFTGKITPGMIDALLAASRQAGWRITLGLNLRDNRPAEAAALTHYAVAHDPSHQLLAVEIGNEPTVYFGSDGDGYIARVSSYVDALQTDPVTRNVQITGSSLSNLSDLGFLTRMRQSFGSRMPFMTWHHYANRPTLTGLLSGAVSTDWTDRLAQVQQAAAGTPTRMDEGNSVGNGGMNRVSNVMGSTAWLTDAMLTGAESGLSGYNAHAWDGYYYPAEKRTAYYTPFVVRAGLVAPRPEYYALALLKNIAGKQFCQATTVVSAGRSVKSWTLRDPATGHLLVFVVEKDAGDGPVTVVAPTSYTGGAVVSRIADPDGCGGRNTDVEGATLPMDGRFTWSPSPVQQVGGAATYAVGLTACQTALIDISPSAPTPASS